MSAIALVEDGGIAASIQQVEAATVWVASAGFDDAAATVDGAVRMAKYLKAVKESQELIAAAHRLQATALRRVGQIGGERQLPPWQVGMARDFAKMDDGEFETFLGEIDHQAPRTILTHWNNVKRGRDAVRRGRAVIDDGEHESDEDIDEHLWSLAQSASAMLHTYTRDGEPFTVAEVAERLVSDLAPTDDVAAIRKGYVAAVREALHAEAYDQGGDRISPANYEMRVPKWITYRDSEAGWVRIPSFKATIGQLRFMVELREAQAAELAEVASRLRATYELFAPSGDEKKIKGVRPWVQKRLEGVS